MERDRSLSDKIELIKCLLNALKRKVRDKCLGNEENLKISDELEEKLDKIRKLKSAEKVCDSLLDELAGLVNEGIVPYSLVKTIKGAEDLLNEILEGALWWVYSVGMIKSDNKDDVDRQKMIRNFAAHAGTEMNVTLLKVEEGKLLIGYYRPAVDEIAREL